MVDFAAMGAKRAAGPALPTPPPEDDPRLHANVYSELRTRFVTGLIVPGEGLSTRKLAQELGVSQTPVRDALARLAAEGAVEIRSKRKIMAPAMTPERFDDLLRCRLLLEPEAAMQAMEHIDSVRLKRLRELDAGVDAALASGDVNGYMEANFQFHFTMYRACQQRTILQLIETLWLQFGPFMRVVYGRFGTAHLVDQHQLAIGAIEAQDREALGRAIAADIADGMGLIGRNGLALA